MGSILFEIGYRVIYDKDFDKRGRPFNDRIFRCISCDEFFKRRDLELLQLITFEKKKK